MFFFFFLFFSIHVFLIRMDCAIGICIMLIRQPSFVLSVLIPFHSIRFHHFYPTSIQAVVIFIFISVVVVVVVVVIVILVSFSSSS